jgi:hypothetical protein
MKIEDIRDLLQSALQALENPTPAALKRAERLTEDANAAIRELTDPPDPYKDMKLRPGLGGGSYQPNPGDNGHLTHTGQPVPKEHPDG